MRRSVLFYLIMMITITIVFVIASSALSESYAVSAPSGVPPSEVGPVPPVVPGDSGLGSQPAIIEDNNHDIFEIEIHPHKSYIDGHVNEDTDTIVEDPSNPDEDSLVIPGKGIKGVIASEESGAFTTYTGDDGYYRIDPGEGPFHLKFRYGDIEAVNKRGIHGTAATVSDVLGYNGHDYIVTSVDGHVKTTKMSVTYSEIVNSGKGACQVYILIDGSHSMQEDIEINGVTTTRFKQVLESSKTIIHELLADGNNIYIGIIAFAGRAWRAAGLSKDEAFLMDVIDKLPDIDEDAYAGNTDILHALEKAEESFYVDPTRPDYLDHCNRNIILVSDGVPSIANGVGITYEDCLPSGINSWLDKMNNHIIPDTRNKLLDLMAQNIKITFLSTPIVDSTVQEIVDELYVGAVEKLRIAEDDAAIAQIIKSEIEEWIESQIEEETEYEEYEEWIKGYEDEDRREAVDCEFDKTVWYNYNDTGYGKIANRSALFKETEPKETGQFVISDGARELSDRTHMTVDGGTHQIECKAATCPLNNTIRTETFEGTDGKTYTKTILTVCQDFPYTVNMTLQRREQFSMYTKVTATGLKVVLSDGTVLCNKTANMDDTTLLMEVIDDNICHGAQIEIEYTIEVMNCSPIICTHLELVNFMPKGFLYDGETDLLTSKGKNKDYKWLAVNIDDLYTQDAYGRLRHMLEEDVYNKYREDNKTAIIYTLDNDGKGNDGFFLNTNQKYTAKVVVTRVLDTAYDLEGAMQSDAEILGYSNNYKDGKSRRMNLVSSADEFAGRLVGVYPGDGKLYNLTNIEMDAHTLKRMGVGIDYAPSSNEVYIIPPTGNKYVASKIAGISLAIGLFAIAALVTHNKKICR